MENPIRMDDSGVPFFFGNTQMKGMGLGASHSKFVWALESSPGDEKIVS